MKKKLKYTPLAIAAMVVSAIALLGTYIIYSALNNLMNPSSIGDYSNFTALSGDTMMNTIFIFFFGIIATAVVAIIQIVFFIYEERKWIVLGSGIIEIIEFILFLRFFDTIISSLINGMSSIILGSSLSQTQITNSIMGSLQLTLVVSLIGLILNVIIVLQMYHVIHLSFLDPYMPTLPFRKSEKQQDHSSQDEGGEQS